MSYPLVPLVNQVWLGDGTGMFDLDTTAIQVTPSLNYNNENLINLNTNTEYGDVDAIVSFNYLIQQLPNVSSVVIPVAWFANDLRCASAKIMPGFDNSYVTTPVTWGVETFTLSNGWQTTTNQYTGDVGFRGTPNDQSLIRFIVDMWRQGIKVTLLPIVLMDIPYGNTLPNPYSANGASLGQPVYPKSDSLTVSVAQGQSGTIYGTSDADVELSTMFGTCTTSSFAITVNGDGSLTVDASSAALHEYSYSRFISYYARLAAAINLVWPGAVDTFSIGYRLPGLTGVYDATAGNYPFVNSLAAMANDVAGLFSVSKSGITVTYVASEFEWNVNVLPDGDYYFNMDTLWTATGLDIIGLSWMQPMSDWRHANTANIDFQLYNQLDQSYLQANIEGGENYAFTYASYDARLTQDRTQVDINQTQWWVGQSKNIRDWWLNYHHVKIDGIIQPYHDAWVPGSKSFRFVEVGFPAIDLCTNQPGAVDYVNQDAPDTTTLPYFSDGSRDDALQTLAVQSFISYWNASNQQNSNGTIYLVDTERPIAIRQWQMRPYPWWPLLDQFWQDTADYSKGYSLSGRDGSFPITTVVPAADYTKLLTEQFLANPLWQSLAETMSRVNASIFHAPVNELLNMRNVDEIEPSYKAQTVNMMGFKIPSFGLSEGEYDRLMRGYGTFIQTSGASSQFVNFLSYVRNQQFTYIPLFLKDVNAYGNVSASNPLISGITDSELLINGGEYIPTPWYDVTFDVESDPDLPESEYRTMFITLQPSHLVLNVLAGILNIPAVDVYAVAWSNIYDRAFISTIAVGVLP